MINCRKSKKHVFENSILKREMLKFDKNVYLVYGFTKYIAGEQVNRIQAQLCI